jgi:adenylate cyclase
MSAVESMREAENTIEEDLYFEILKSERTRIRALMSVMGVLFSLAFASLALPSDPISPLIGGEFPLAAIAIFYAAAFLYELGAHTIVSAAIANRRRLPEPPRYANAAIETSLPTIMIIFLSNAVGAEIALNSPLTLLYFLFISLSTLRLAASLAIFTGCVAGIEFAALGIHYLGAEPGPRTFLTSPWPIALKSVLLVVTGFACGFVAAQIRARLVASLQLLGDKNRVLGVFGQYASPAVVEQLMTKRFEERGDVRDVTVMFLDIRGFTAFSERRSPQEVVDYLNTLFAMMIGVVNANHGIINKFLGDGFMACFGAPLSHGRDTHNAVRAALDIAREVERMSADGTIAATRIGIGIHAGQAVTGSVGSAERREYTIIGDTVNFASRVEQLTKRYASSVLVTDAVWRTVKEEYPGQALAAVTVPGREQLVEVYALR